MMHTATFVTFNINGLWPNVVLDVKKNTKWVHKLFYNKFAKIKQAATGKSLSSRSIVRWVRRRGTMSA